MMKHHHAKTFKPRHSSTIVYCCQVSSKHCLVLQFVQYPCNWVKKSDRLQICICIPTSHIIAMHVQLIRSPARKALNLQNEVSTTKNQEPVQAEKLSPKVRINTCSRTSLQKCMCTVAKKLSPTGCECQEMPRV